MMEIEISQVELRYARLRIGDAVRLSRLVASLQQHGQQTPVLVVAEGEPRRFVLIDGYARVAALRSLARDVVAAAVLDVPEADALVLGHRLESTRRRTGLEEGWLVDELVRSHGLDQRDIARRLQRSASWVNRRLSLVRVLPATVQDAVRTGRVPPHAAMKHLVPLARANAGECETLVAGLAPHVVTTRQLERIYRTLGQSNAETRARIITNPWLFLRALEAVQPEKVPAGDPVEPLIRDLEGVAGLSRRARRRLRDGVLGAAGSASRGAVERVFAQAKLAFSSLDEAFAEEVGRAGPGYPGSDPEAA
jgi:ParB family chromosome partitioning protein